MCRLLSRNAEKCKFSYIKNTDVGVGAGFGLIDMLSDFFLMMLIVNRVSFTSVWLFFLCFNFFFIPVLRCSGASHATRGQRPAVTSQGGPLKEKGMGGGGWGGSRRNHLS